MSRNTHAHTATSHAHIDTSRAHSTRPPHTHAQPSHTHTQRTATLHACTATSHAAQPPHMCTAHGHLTWAQPPHMQHNHLTRAHSHPTCMRIATSHAHSRFTCVQSPHMRTHSTSHARSYPTRTHIATSHACTATSHAPPAQGSALRAAVTGSELLVLPRTCSPPSSSSHPTVAPPFHLFRPETSTVSDSELCHPPRLHHLHNTARPAPSHHPDHATVTSCLSHWATFSALATCPHSHLSPTGSHRL